MQPCIDSVARWVVFSPRLWVSFCVTLFVCLFVNTMTLEPFEISSGHSFLYGSKIKSPDEFENGCIPMPLWRASGDLTFL